MEKVQEFSLIVHDIHVERMVLLDVFVVVTVIEKFHPSLKDFKSHLKHKQKKMTLLDFIVKQRIEADMRKQDKPKASMDTKANLMEYGDTSNKRARPSTKDNGKAKVLLKKFDGVCYNCGKHEHTTRESKLPKKKKKKYATNVVEKDNSEFSVVVTG